MECEATYLDFFIGLTIGVIATLIVFAANSDYRKKGEKDGKQ